MTEILPAGSLILMRRGSPGEPAEILFVVRATALRFGGGADAFPGGRVDAADMVLAARYPSLGRDDAAARIAAIRETWEETGVAIGFAATAGMAFGEAIGAGPPNLTTIAPFARWLPPQGIARRFDTRFYVAEAPPSARPVADGGETAAVFWATAGAVRARWRAGGGHALFPTRRLVERLETFADAASAAADPHSDVDDAIEARLDRRADGDWVTIPEGRGYPIREERMTDRLRS